METIISIDGLSKHYSDGWGRRAACALENLSLKLDVGQLLGICGGNGSGKTTLLKIICGLLPHYEGQVQLSGERPADAVGRQLLGFVPERPTFPSHHSPRSFLRYCGKLGGLAGKELATQVEQVLQRVGLQEQAEEKLSRQSKGNLQRLALAQALVHEPNILIADEPMDGLDPLAREQAEALFRELVAEGKTVIFATHLLEGLEELCDQLLVLHQGKAVFQGLPRFEAGLKSWLIGKLREEGKNE